MRIAFILIGNSRRSNYLNGETLRYGGGGGSGTDTSTILVAEYLASQGHDVVVVTEKMEPLLEEAYAREGKFFPKGDKIRGVQYTDIDFNYIENKEFDVLVNSLWFHDYNKLPIKVTKSLIYWCHMQWIYGIDESINYAKENNLSLGFVNISEWEKSMNKELIEHTINRYDRTKHTLIPNPICDDVIREVISQNIEKKPHKFVFHASWARGGNVAVEAVEHLDFPDKEFHAFDYLITIHDHKYPFFRRHDGVDKSTLFKHIAESEYFLYPLYTPYQDVHKDTFSCVVAEAIALGVIPITYPLGALPENFEGYCQWIKFPDGIDPEVLQKEALTKDLDGKFKNNIDNIIDSINYLEQNPEIKNNIRKTGQSHILDNFNVERVGNMWTDFIKNL
jgi:glycosyltransferase involved in cell wall biosynthesis